MLDSPSGVVTGFRRDVACNVSKTKNCIASRNVVLTPNAKSRLRPLGGLKPALCLSSGVNAGLVKRHPYWDCAQAQKPFLPQMAEEGFMRVSGWECMCAHQITMAMWLLSAVFMVMAFRLFIPEWVRGNTDSLFGIIWIIQLAPEEIFVY